MLRVLVHWLNRLVFRTTVSPAGLVPAEGPVIIAPVHRSFIDFFVASEVTDRKLHYMAKDSLWKNTAPGPDPAVGRGASRSTGSPPTARRCVGPSRCSTPARC